MKRIIKFQILFLFLFTALFISCGSVPKTYTMEQAEENTILQDSGVQDERTPKDTLTLLFAGDIMAHNVNYYVSSYDKIWRDVKYLIEPADLAFANIEAPIDTTKPASSYPSFNMTKKYVIAAIDAGFDVFSLCNNHTNDQYAAGIRETIKTTTELTKEFSQKGRSIYFSGLKTSEQAQFTYNIINRNGWKIIFIPITELLNRPDASELVNYVRPNEKSRLQFIELIKKIKSENECDLFIISVHTAEPEYTRNVTEAQDSFYMNLLENGADIVWANHAHIIKNRKIVSDTRINRDKIIMYANGNTISGQRTKPEFYAHNPNSERDNTGDGLFYKITIQKNNANKSLKLLKAEPLFITTYINTANEYVIKPLNSQFVEYLYSVPRKDWAKYIEKRIKINNKETKDFIIWQ